MAEDKVLEVTPKSGNDTTIFDFRGSGYKKGEVLAIDFGDGASTGVTVSDDGHWHVNYRFGTEGTHEVTTKYVGDEEVLDTAKVRVS